MKNVFIYLFLVAITGWSIATLIMFIHIIAKMTYHEDRDPSHWK